MNGLRGAAGGGAAAQHAETSLCILASVKLRNTRRAWPLTIRGRHVSAVSLEDPLDSSASTSAEGIQQGTRYCFHAHGRLTYSGLWFGLHLYQEQ